MLNKSFLIVLFCIVIGFLFGWLFPVEGPIDYIYDNKVPVKNGPSIKPITEIYVDLDEDEVPEWYWVIKPVKEN